MFEKLFVKTSDFVFHKIAPYAVERERFLEHCCEEGFSKVGLIRFRGHFPRGGYDVQNGIKQNGTTSATTVHGGVQSRRSPTGAR